MYRAQEVGLVNHRLYVAAALDLRRIENQRPDGDVVVERAAGDEKNNCGRDGDFPECHTLGPSRFYAQPAPPLVTATGTPHRGNRKDRTED